MNDPDKILTEKQEACKKATSFATFQELIAWAKGEILIAVGEGRYRQAVVEVAQVAARWGYEGGKIDQKHGQGLL